MTWTSSEALGILEGQRIIDWTYKKSSTLWEYFYIGESKEIFESYIFRNRNREKHKIDAYLSAIKLLDLLPCRVPVLSLWHFGNILDPWCLFPPTNKLTVRNFYL